MSDTKRLAPTPAERLSEKLRVDDALRLKLATKLYENDGIDWEEAHEFLVATFGEPVVCEACDCRQCGYPGCPCPECGEALPDATA